MKQIVLAVFCLGIFTCGVFSGMFLYAQEDWTRGFNECQKLYEPD